MDEMNQHTGETDPSPDENCCSGAPAASMGIVDAQALATRFAALADGVRLRMLSIIASSEAGEICACDFVGPIEKSQPTVSHHLKVLAEAGLVTGDKRGRWVWYRLTPGAAATLTDALGDVVSAPAGA